MAIGWTDDDAVLDQIQDSVNDEVNRARRNVPCGESLLYCEECGEEIPEARRHAIRGVRLCIDCQEEADRQNKAVSLYNRRGSKTVSSNNFFIVQLQFDKTFLILFAYFE